MEQAASDSIPRLVIHSNLWAEVGGQVVLSPWRVKLLEAIEATGSIRAAAASMNVTYDLAWHRIDEMETALGAGLVDRQRGGPKGGCANLTSLGCELVARFKLFEEHAESLVGERFREVFGEGDWRALPDLRGGK
ncbi:MAG: LysR family transcriptional regulator [Anaerolineae bacterium]|jgi:molybdate transport system regulatory protein|nr:LysR family transcriptional regulator [Anaerolineae bacterium]